MDLSDQDVQEFIDIWQAEFGERLEMEIARAEAKRLLRFFMAIANAKLQEPGFDETYDDGTMRK